VLRSWPWIIVGVASLVYFPSLVDAEQSYPMMIDEFLPVGLKGIMVASLLAAFMSTLDTQLNWGSSYLVNDVYEPYLVKGREKAHYIKAARISMLALTLVALIVTTQLESILGAYEYISVIIIPISVVLIARWYWWRINVWSEISALITAVIVGNTMMYILPDEGEAKWFAVRMLATTMTTLVVCLVVTLMTSSKTPSPKTIEFYSRLKIHGRGWKKVRDLTGIEPIAAGIKDNAIACVASIAFIYSLLLGIGNALFEDWQTFGYYLIVIVASGWVVKHKMPKVIASLRQEV
jgi:SSS family solute:Na+ symporter